jgi:hypothetical protein
MELEAPSSSTTGLPTRQPKEKDMRRSLFGVVLGVSLVIAVAAGRGTSAPAYAEMDSPARSGNELMAQVSATEGQALTVTVVDPKQRVLAVYHVDRATGAIALKSVRNITYDLQMVEFNSGNPLPQDIRNSLKH